ncbi:hypothetical protein C0993_008472 [Termitomyces sp. T159_Od127]|nr:hypothetical protein C0993_008472 [Termitomyces sp. T159_Od127]
MALSLNTPLAHLPSKSSQILLLRTTLPHSSAPNSTLVDSGATNNFIDESLATLAATLQKLPLPVCLTLFDGSSTSTSDVTHYMQTTLTFANGQHEAGATSAPTAPLSNSGKPPFPWHTLSTPPAFPPNIPCNKYKGPNYPIHRPWMPSDPDDVDQPPKPLDPDALDIKIISPAPFACIIQDGTPTFQLHISLVLLKEHLGADTTTLETKTEEQILHEVVPPEYHEFADLFSEGSTKELPPH